MQKFFACAAVLGVAFLATPVQALPMFELQGVDFSGMPGTCSGSVSAVFSSVPVSRSFSCTRADATPNSSEISPASANASGSANFGLLGASSHLTLNLAPGDTNSVFGVQVNTNSIASVWDNITVNGGTGGGYLGVDVVIDGTSSGEIFFPGGKGHFRSGAGFTAADMSSTIPALGSFVGPITGPTRVSGSIPITFGQEFLFRMYLEAFNEIRYSGPGPADLFGFADFASTAVLQPFTILDSNLNPISGGTGFQYQVLGNAASVPEPSTLALFGASLAGLTALRRRKNRQANVTQ
jgi:PEP-CTERM motif